MDASPFYASTSPLRFRGIPDSLAATHLEASECCLIHADNMLSAKKGVWLNPRVRVGYSIHAYQSVHPGAALSSVPEGYDEAEQEGPWISAAEVFVGIWKNRFRRWLTTDVLKTGIVQHRLEEWRKTIRSSTKEGMPAAGEGSRTDNENLEGGLEDEKGKFCLINEMQVLVANGWAHV
jgi:hypothetical protein